MPSEKFIFFDSNYKIVDDVKDASYFNRIFVDSSGEIIEETFGEITN